MCAGAHYFCETLDLTRPFPSDRPPTQPSWEFVWNRWLTASFRGIGLGFVCPALMQVCVYVCVYVCMHPSVHACKPWNSSSRVCLGKCACILFA